MSSLLDKDLLHFVGRHHAIASDKGTSKRGSTFSFSWFPICKVHKLKVLFLKETLTAEQVNFCTSKFSQKYFHVGLSKSQVIFSSHNVKSKLLGYHGYKPSQKSCGPSTSHKSLCQVAHLYLLDTADKYHLCLNLCHHAYSLCQSLSSPDYAVIIQCLVDSRKFCLSMIQVKSQVIYRKSRSSYKSMEEVESQVKNHKSSDSSPNHKT